MLSGTARHGLDALRDRGAEQGRKYALCQCLCGVRDLPEAIKRRIEGRRALNAYDYDTAATKRGTKVADGVPTYVHPVVRTHPATDRKALYVNRLMTVGIEDMPEEESTELLDFLFDHQEQRQFIYEHVWRVGDILMWDNRCTLHARTDFSAGERRLMRRVTILGEKPI